MKRVFLMLLCLLLACLPLTGCWSQKELNQLAIAVGIGIDKKDDKYLLTAQIVDPNTLASKTGGLTYTPAIAYSIEANTIEDGLRRMTTITPRPVYLAHLRALVISEQVAREGTVDALDFFSRYHQIRSDFVVTIARGATAKQVLEVLTQLDKVPSTKIFTSLKASEKYWAPTSAVYLDEIINSMVSVGKEAVITCIVIDGDKTGKQSIQQSQRVNQETMLKFAGIGVFKKDKLVGWMNEFESKGYNYIENKVKSTAVFVPCDHHRTTAELTEKSAEIKGKVINGKPEIDLDIRCEGTLTQLGCNLDLSKAETLQFIQKQMHDKIVRAVNTSIRTAQQKYDSDIFGFGQAIHRADPQAWKRLKKNWDKEFAQLPVNVHVDFQIRGTGSEGGSFITDMEKEKQ